GEVDWRECVLRGSVIVPLNISLDGIIQTNLLTYKNGMGVGAITIREDPEGEVERIALYNWVEQTALPAKDREKVFTIKQASKLLPIGTKLAIKNPYYQVASSFDTLIHTDGPSITTDFDSIIRSDNPKDVIVINQDNELFNKIKWSKDLGKRKNDNGKNELSVDDEKKLGTADDFRQSGNQYFISNDFAAAVDEYSSGIELEPHNVTLLANRAEAYLRLGRFEKALTDVEITLNREPDHLKAAVRKGKALIGLIRYQEAIITLKDVNLMMQTSTNNDEILITSIKQSAKELLKRAEMFDSENRYGRYDYKSIIDEFCEKVAIKSNNQDNDDWVCGTGPRLDHAEYLIDDIEIRPVENKGRGWIAKRDIPEDTLLMVSKAFKVVYGNEAPLSFRSIDFTPGTESMNTATHSELASRIAQELIAEPELFREVYQLYAGPDMVPMENLDQDSLNSVDTRRIEKIVKYNFFEPMDEWNVLCRAGEDSRLTKDFGAGLWILPSYFNHSCVDKNIQKLIIGDMMFLRSLRPILKDEELILEYCSPSRTYEKRSSKLKSYGVNCQCRLCELDRSESKQVKLRRDEISVIYENYLGPQVKSTLHSPYFDPSLVNELTNLIAESHELRKDHPDLDFLAYEMKNDLAMAYVKVGKLRQSLPVTKEIYDFLKTIQMFSLTCDAAYQVSSRYARLGQMKEGKKWFDVALKELAEPIRGKYNKEEIHWRKEALYLAKKLTPKMIVGARNKGLVS
ncbi:4446_t:CDS:2, partial [Funneliformis caledonium]